MFIDVHAHLDDEAFDSDRLEVLDDIKKAGIIVVNAGSDLYTSRFSVKLAEENDFIYACVGIHPHEARKAGSDYIKELKSLAQNPKVIAIGEIGLDYYYDLSEREIQKEVFTKQLQLANDLGLPVVVHNREAHQDTLEILKKVRPEKGLMHCYSGSLEMAQEFQKLGFSFSFGGIITFKNAKRPKQVAAALPLENILLETDCPYLSPKPYRGKRNNPAHIPIIARQLAKLRGISVKEVKNATYSNFKRLFNPHLE